MTAPKTPNATCLICGTPFCRPSRGGKYCSQRCNGASRVGKKMHPDHVAKATVNRLASNPRLPSGPQHPNWRGGVTHNGNGYRVLSSKITRQGRNKYQHRAVMEAHLGRALRSDEIVHHLNHDKADNRIENLALMSRADHVREHKPRLRRAA